MRTHAKRKIYAMRKNLMAYRVRRRSFASETPFI